MKSEEIKTLFIQFEQASAEIEDAEYWSARELHSSLGYTPWRIFLPAIERAKKACQQAGEDISYHFADIRKMVPVGSGALYERGIDSKGFAIIRSKGDKALFRFDTNMLKRKLGTPEGRPLADFLSTIGIKAKDLAAEMISVNVQQKELFGQKPIEKEHIDNNAVVRNMLVNRGIVPENLPPAEDIKKVERKLRSDEKKALKNKNK